MISIVPATSAYASKIADLVLSIQREEFGIDITLRDQADLLDIAGFYQTGAGNFWVALDEHDVVGTIASRDIGSGQCALRKMFVKATHRGREHGVASRLLARLTEHARQAGTRQIYLGTTARFLAAHRFYEKNGFQPVPEDGLPAAFPRMAVDTRFYRLELE